MPHNSAGLDLPFAIMLLVSCVLQNTERIDQEIVENKQKVEKERDENKRDRIVQYLSELKMLKDKISEYRRRLANNTEKYLLIGTFDIATGKIEAPQFGMLSMISAAKPDFSIIVPEESEVHAALIAKAKKNVKAYKAANLEEVWNIILGAKPQRVRWSKDGITKKVSKRVIPDLRNIEGIPKAKEAMMVALAGGHNILLVGPPGQGKTMLTEAAMGLLPAPSQRELFEINKVHSAAGELGGNELILERPFKKASKGINETAFLGGGRPPRPGLVSLAHRGILFLDEINYFPGTMIHRLLLEPMNDQKIFVQRTPYKTEFPCNFILVAAMNPCECGWYGHYFCTKCNKPFLEADAVCPDHPHAKLVWRCDCTPSKIDRHKRSLSGAILDRIDLKILLVYMAGESGSFNYSTQTIKRKIKKARETQERRYRGIQGIHCNGDVRYKAQFRDISTEIQNYLKNMCGELNVRTLRTRDKVLLVAQTIADLNESTRITKKHINIAVDLMGLNNPYFEDF